MYAATPPRTSSELGFLVLPRLPLFQVGVGASAPSCPWSGSIAGVARLPWRSSPEMPRASRHLMLMMHAPKCRGDELMLRMRAAPHLPPQVPSAHDAWSRLCSGRARRKRESDEAGSKPFFVSSTACYAPPEALAQQASAHGRRPCIIGPAFSAGPRRTSPGG